MSFRMLTEVDRLSSLLRDLRRLQENNVGASDLGSDAPVLRNYRMTARLPAYLEEDGQLYARTLSRWYRLEASFDLRQIA